MYAGTCQVSWGELGRFVTEQTLPKLRDAGVVDAAQFEQLRAQILGQSGL